MDEAAVEDGAEEIMMEVEEVVAEVEAAAAEVDEGVVGVDEAIMKDEVEEVQEVEIAEEDNNLLNKFVYVWHIGLWKRLYWSRIINQLLL